MSTEAFAEGTAARHSQNSRDPFHAGGRFRGFHDSHICYGLPVCSAPCTDLTGFPANGAFYIQAFNGSVALPAVGYDYSIDWTPMLVGLSPTRMAASLAARSSPPRCGPGQSICRWPGAGSPSFRCIPFARDVFFDPGRATAPRIAVPHILPSTFLTASAPALLSISWLNRHPMQSLCTLRGRRCRRLTQHSLPGALLGLPGPIFHRLDYTSFGWRLPRN